LAFEGAQRSQRLPSDAGDRRALCTSCFHAQQVIEKSLKALLAFHGQPVPRTHDLEELQRLCSPLQALPTLARYDFSETTDYGVLVRYDLEFSPDQSTASDAVTQAEQVFDLVVNTLPAECRP
jgi:HEPN domain-containing protein